MNLKIADFFIGTFSGSLVAGVVHYLLPPVMPMLLGGVIGMLLVLPLKILLMPFFGAFEVMIPLGIIGMTVGMTAGALSTLTSGNIVIASGGVMGFIISAIIYFSNKRLTSR
ncbi:MAG: hypothetical protein COW89_09195 [Nitrospinae bacterium CG22_combo_CG10-13_8_21_14_all_47_10]|jgi:hypothetical protein|nr:MAG: hypothetical protein COW89_09195 [Nitrospinae bacterium CG22_combo_CG10-13_8_21_14_all_47_10]